MSEKFLKGTREIKVEPLRTIRLEYYVMEEFAESEETAAYGIAVVKKENDITETEVTGGISYDRAFVEEMADRLMEGLVTPMTLVDTADDWITEKLCS